MTAAIHSNPAIIQLTDCPPNPPNPPILPVLLRIQIIFCLLFCLRLSADFMCRRMNERVIIRLLDFLDEEGEVEGGGTPPSAPLPPPPASVVFPFLRETSLQRSFHFSCYIKQTSPLFAEEMRWRAWWVHRLVILILMSSSSRCYKLSGMGKPLF